MKTATFRRHLIDGRQESGGGHRRKVKHGRCKHRQDSGCRKGKAKAKPLGAFLVPMRQSAIGRGGGGRTSSQPNLARLPCRVDEEWREGNTIGLDSGSGSYFRLTSVSVPASANAKLLWSAAGGSKGSLSFVHRPASSAAPSAVTPGPRRYPESQTRQTTPTLPPSFHVLRHQAGFGARAGGLKRRDGGRRLVERPLPGTRGDLLRVMAAMR